MLGGFGSWCRYRPAFAQESRAGARWPGGRALRAQLAAPGEGWCGDSTPLFSNVAYF